MTGEHSQRASCFSILANNDSFVENQTMFPAYLQESGYRTGYIGKFHSGREKEPQKGFDFWASFPFVGAFFNEPIWVNGEKVEKEGFTDYNIAGFMNGECWFETLEYAKEEGRQGFPHRFFNRFNPPLNPGPNLMWMRVIVPQGEGLHRFRLDQLYPAGILDFELEH